MDTKPVAKIRVVTSDENIKSIELHCRLLNYINEKHAEVFSMADAKDYVVALPPSKNMNKPVLKFFDNKNEMIAFVKNHPQAVFEYRFSEQMELMY